jgi:hypothetical protein
LEGEDLLQRARKVALVKHSRRLVEDGADKSPSARLLGRSKFLDQIDHLQQGDRQAAWDVIYA